MSLVIPKVPVQTAKVAPIQSEAPAEGQAPVEGVQEVKDTLEPGDEQLSPKFAALARKEKAFLRREQELKSREDAIKAKENEYATNYIPKSRLKESPAALLAEEGISAETLLSEMAQGADPTSQHIRKLEKKIAELEGRYDSDATKKAEADKAQYDKALDQIRGEVTELVDANTEYEAIKANDAQEHVVQLIKDTFDQTGKIISVEQAAKQVEDFIMEQALKLASLGKVKSRLNPPAPEPKEQLPKAQVSVTPKTLAKIPTLTNATTVTPSKPLTQKERRERAIAAMRGELVR